MNELKLAYNPYCTRMYDAEELVAAMCGIDDVTDEFLESSAVEDFLYERYEIDISTFEKIIGDLLPLCRSSEIGITKTLICGFIEPDKPWYVLKTEV